MNEAPLRCTKDDRIGSYFSLEMFLSVTGFKTCSRGFFSSETTMTCCMCKRQTSNVPLEFLERVILFPVKKVSASPPHLPLYPFSKIDYDSEKACIHLESLERIDGIKKAHCCLY